MLPGFDELKKLAEQDPERLETLRQQWVEETISDAPEQFQRRLRGLQFQIDMEREKAKNPVSACIRVSKMMHDSLAKLYETITQENAISVAAAPAAQAAEPAKLSVGEVIQFPFAAAE